MAKGRYTKKGSNKGCLVVMLILTMLVTIGCVIGIWLVLDEETPPTQTPGTVQTEGTTLPETSGEAEAPTTAPKEETTAPAEETTAPTEETTVPTEATTVPTQVPTLDWDETVGAQIAQTALAQIGKPYQSGGSGPDAFDTAGFVSYCLKENRQISGRMKIKDLAQRGSEVPREQLQPGDVVFFWSSNEGQIEYAGIYVGDGQFVAARNEQNPVTQMSLATGYFSDRYLFARRFG